MIMTTTIETSVRRLKPGAVKNDTIAMTYTAAVHTKNGFAPSRTKESTAVSRRASLT